jgi:hypothetical protein
MTATKDCIAEAGKTAGIAGGIGLFVSAMQNTATKHTTGARGVITRTGGTIAFFGKDPSKLTEKKTKNSKLIFVHYLFSCYGWYFHSW